LGVESRRAVGSPRARRRRRTASARADPSIIPGVTKLMVNCFDFRALRRRGAAAAPLPASHLTEIPIARDLHDDFFFFFVHILIVVRFVGLPGLGFWV